MGLYFKLMLGTLRRALWLREDLVRENLLLRQQLDAMAPASAVATAGNGGPMSPDGLVATLDVNEPSPPPRAAAHRS